MDQQAPLHQLEDLTEEIRQHHEEYTIADWKEAYARYEQIATEMEKYHYSSDEAEKIDNFVDDRVLSLLDKRTDHVEATIH